MGDAATTKEEYIKMCAEAQKEPNSEIIAIFNVAMDDFLDVSPEFELKLHANKRNERNEMYRKKLTDEDANVLYKTLKANTFVVSVDLAYNNIGDEGAKLFGKLLMDTLVLQSLNMSYNDIGPDGGEAIAKGVQVNETLRVLKLNGNKIGNRGGMAIAGALQVNTALEDLDLAQTDMKIESMIAIATVLNSNNTLRSLSLNRPVLSISHQEETNVHLANMLKVNIQLRELHLQCCDIKDFGALRLVENLFDNLTLKHLDLSRNQITMDGAQHLSILLKKNTPLEVLNLAYNRIEDDGAVALAEALAAFNTNLTTLVIRGNSVAKKGLCAVARSMKSNSTLLGVYVWGNKLEEPACKDFQELINGFVPRLSSQYTDVEPYVVDGHVFLAELSCPY